MQITDNHVVSMNYTLKNDEGIVIDTSENRDPLQFIMGQGMIIPGLETAIKGKQTGDEISVSLAPSEGYGDYDESNIIAVPTSQFQEGTDITVGMHVQAQRPDGDVQILIIKEINGEEVTLDANHPLAGQTLHFTVQIESVRAATEEELAPVHVH